MGSNPGQLQFWLCGDDRTQLGQVVTHVAGWPWPDQVTVCGDWRFRCSPYPFTLHGSVSCACGRFPVEVDYSKEAVITMGEVVLFSSSTNLREEVGLNRS